MNKFPLDSSPRLILDMIASCTWFVSWYSSTKISSNCDRYSLAIGEALPLGQLIFVKRSVHNQKNPVHCDYVFFSKAINNILNDLYKVLNSRSQTFHIYF